MLRRTFHQATVGILCLAALRQAHALSLGDLSNADASSGLKAALGQGAQAAVALLGRTDGFLGNPQVRIALPGSLEDAARLLRRFGQGKRIDELVVTLEIGQYQMRQRGLLGKKEVEPVAPDPLALADSMARNQIDVALLQGRISLLEETLARRTPKPHAAE